MEESRGPVLYCRIVVGRKHSPPYPYKSGKKIESGNGLFLVFPSLIIIVAVTMY
jgi:hypothetical protein